MNQNVIDISMTSKLDKDKYYTEKREIATVASGKSLEILATSGTRITTVESIAKVLSLAAVINPGISNDINEFIPILTKWESFDFTQKCKEYSSHICNELNFFIYFKDKEFFDQVIQPFIKSKLIKSFMDKWLLNEDLIEYIEDSKKYNSLNDFEIILLYFPYKSNSTTVKTLENYLKNEIIRMEKNGILCTNETEKIFNTIIENGEELDKNKYNDDESNNGNDNAEDLKSSKGYSFGGPPHQSSSLGCAFALPPKKSSSLFNSNSFTYSNTTGSIGSTGSGLFSFGAVKSIQLMNKDNMSKLNNIKEQVNKTGPMFYEEIEKTSVWSETGHWKKSINETIDIKMSPFWKDVFESSDSEGKVLSKNFISVINKSFTELIFACALMDLPLIGQDNQNIILNSQTYKINAKSNIIVLYKQLMVK